MYLNKAFIIGNLTRDPELKALPSGMQVCSFSVATNRVWKDRNGARQESADYHNIVVFGRSAETSAQYLKKGSSVLIEGRIQTRSWDDKSTGEKKYRTEIVADRVQFGNRPGGGSAGDVQSDSKSTDKSAPPMDTIEYPAEEINPEDIPF
ncbi:MAG: single-stranded DNA-binding protein [Candidatus Taylorbacteria bacterium CG10_big_fil_rev_8_21_14_0_10_41_48]|uniref:Single-stranded DNA-binding protein n=1 Tax=Candidatus Taylorbacteria bacterium CG10_big_fil_rev_8_21_14_0_10_41_48 TaxID=1975024 RepID=A0A2M8LDB2_9BACT|nr:MAG: single-stranded DNA-binding protein [Candidatus Taylorbacteria bacterium CG10_big_fil_rev_8_21_14_0_10_41_48]